MTVQTAQLGLQLHGLSYRRPWIRLPLTSHHKQELLQLCDQRRFLSRNGVTCFQNNPGSVCSTLKASSVFVASWNVHTLAHHLNRWYGMPLDRHLRSYKSDLEYLEM
ncbi:hypothetical protein LAZ67_10001019 [Cordylochernes scorpioides]|uniref:Uncharacterized protein n=1 Tax=Cordylochernes scorpioides TaxID=51811 RepID=A0ABY6KVZ0_9ARAC|nr:hypothetical protein LAZ67_10001019 [Cordylochernes scorpioides]